MKKDSGSAKMTREVLAHIGRFVTVSFLCVILERSEESRSLFFGLFFVSFRAAAAKNPGVLIGLVVTPAPSDVAYRRLKMRVAFSITCAPRTAGSVRRRFARTSRVRMT